MTQRHSMSFMLHMVLPVLMLYIHTVVLMPATSSGKVTSRPLVTYTTSSLSSTISAPTPLESKNVILTDNQCKRYLCKYGYMRCDCANLARKRRRSVWDVGFFPVELKDPTDHNVTTEQPTITDSSIPCTEASYKNALQAFQGIYRLPLTGKCDNITKESMSLRRCGQPDIIDEKEEESWMLVTPARKKRNLQDIISKSIQLQNSVNRRNRLLLEYKDRLGTNKPTNGVQRNRRAVLNSTIYDFSGYWQKLRISWQLMGDHLSSIMSLTDQRAILTMAFRYWSEVTPLCFREETSSAPADIQLGFLEGLHLSCLKPFDGFGGEVAHKYYHDVHFDKAEPFTATTSSSNSSISLLLVAVHEIGHILGLNHSSFTDSVMNAIYSRTHQGVFELSDYDRNEIRRVYGQCDGSLDEMFDYVRWRVTPNTGLESRVYNSYIFRSNHFWMYENSNARPRYGDPLTLTPDWVGSAGLPSLSKPEWAGVPTSIDAFLHYYELRLVAGKLKIIDDYFFFKADKYYQWNSTEERVKEIGYIKNKFPTGSNGAIPSNLDSAYFDMRTKLVYFFKADLVYTYQYRLDAPHSCCVAPPQKIADLFPPATPSDLASPTGSTYARDIDSVYFSYFTISLYIIKGNDIWKNDAFSLSPLTTDNRIKYLGKWNNIWNYVCDAECS